MPRFGSVSRWQVLAGAISGLAAVLLLGLLGSLGCRQSRDAPGPAATSGNRSSPAAEGALAESRDKSPGKPPPEADDVPGGRTAGRRIRHVAPPPRRSANPPPDTLLRFRDVTEESGITFEHTDGSSGRRYIVETMSAGIATFDYDGDGLTDIYFCNGAPLPGARFERPPRPALYQNLGHGRFRDVTEEAGIAGTGFGLGVTAADYDNDGDADLYLSNFGPKVLYRNNGNGTFTDVTREANVADGNRFGAGVCFLDIDGDGRLDLYVANYVKFSFDNHVAHTILGHPVYAGPLDYASETHALFHNQDNGIFRDVSVESGIARRPSPGMGAICTDYDGDGATDIFVCNDGRENMLFRNNGQGQFEEEGLLAGIAFDAVGQPHANMAVDCADYDLDGRLDFYVTAYQNEWATLYRNLDGRLFADVTEESRAGEGSFQYVKWGCGFVDFDNDGRRDLFVGCGHLEDDIDRWDDTTAYRCRNVLLLNTGDGKFVDLSDACGLGALAPHAARGVAFDDLDNDGDIDVVVLNSRERSTLLRNMYYEQGGRNHWLDLRLRGVTSNRDGVGARVRVTAGDLIQIDEVHSGRGYQSHWGSRLHFGLGPRARVDRVEVRWIGGGTDVYENLPSDCRMTLVEGGSRYGP